ncbi:unnamed protein product, partial [Ixodes hexagonus]
FILQELSLSLCDDESCKPSERFEEEKCPLHGKFLECSQIQRSATYGLVHTYSECSAAEAESSAAMHSGLASEVSCNMSLQGEEKQEFSFTLYDFNGHGKVTKDDIASLVRSIYDALGKKSLPKSGSRTIKVRLAIGPDEESSEGKAPAPDKPPPSASSRHSSAATACTLLTDDASAARRSQQPESLSVPHNSGALPSSPLGSRSRRFQSRIHERQELLQWLRESTEKACQQSATKQNNGTPPSSLVQCLAARHRHRNRHRDRSRKKILDVANVSVCRTCVHTQHAAVAQVDTVLVVRCRSRRFERACVHQALTVVRMSVARENNSGLVILTSPLPPLLRRPQPPRHKEAAGVPEACPWEKAPEPAPCPYRLLDHSHDCAQWSPPCERRPHRRSKSYGEGGAAPCSGTHHHYRHRERDLERQRAMRQVASWIQREHLANLDCSRGARPERHEHHHLHEHVHHHYHHYVD